MVLRVFNGVLGAIVRVLLLKVITISKCGTTRAYANEAPSTDHPKVTLVANFRQGVGLGFIGDDLPNTVVVRNKW